MKPQREGPKVLHSYYCQEKVLCKAVTSIETKETNYVLINYSPGTRCPVTLLRCQPWVEDRPSSTRLAAGRGHVVFWPPKPSSHLLALGRTITWDMPKRKSEAFPVLQSSHPLTPPPRPHTRFSINQSNFLMKTCGEEPERDFGWRNKRKQREGLVGRAKLTETGTWVLINRWISILATFPKWPELQLNWEIFRK